MRWCYETSLLLTENTHGGCLKRNLTAKPILNTRFSAQKRTSETTYIRIFGKQMKARKPVLNVTSYTLAIKHTAAVLVHLKGRKAFLMN